MFVIPFSVIEKAPVYEGCQDLNSIEEQKKCFVESVRKHVARKFNTDLANNIGLDNGKDRILAIFKIDSLGNVFNIRTRTPHPKLEEETL